MLNGGELGNIAGNGYNIYYNAALAGNAIRVACLRSAKRRPIDRPDLGSVDVFGLAWGEAIRPMFLFAPFRQECRRCIFVWRVISFTGATIETKNPPKRNKIDTSVG